MIRVSIYDFFYMCFIECLFPFKNGLKDLKETSIQLLKIINSSIAYEWHTVVDDPLNKWEVCWLLYIEMFLSIKSGGSSYLTSGTTFKDLVLLLTTRGPST